MSLGIGVLLLLLLLFPGLVFKFGYLNGHGKYKYPRVGFLDELLISILPAFFFQFVGFLFVEYILRYSVDFALIYQITMGKGDLAAELLKNSLIYFFSYTFIIVTIAFFAGLQFSKLSMNYGWYRKLDFLRLHSDWHFQLFTDLNNCDLIRIQVLTNIGGKAFIYSGILLEFYTNANNELDRLLMGYVFRRPFDKDKVESELEENDDFFKRYYEVPGDIFIINAKDILNMNISYMDVNEELV